MLTKWINQQQNTNLILFFNGWGMDERVLTQMDHTGYDVLMIFNYTTTRLSIPPLKGYRSIILIAWSMGVWAAGQCAINCNHAIAINGTPTPMNDSTGIHPLIFTATHQHWDEKNRLKFNMRVAGGRSAWMAQQQLFPRRSLAEQKEESENIGNQCLTNTKPRSWQKTIIGNADAIFLPSNQHQYWDNVVTVKELPIPHWPFQYFTNWQSIIEL